MPSTSLPSSLASSDHPIFRLLEVMARLRDPNGGCPWDVEQTFATIAPYTIEEAYEVADAIAGKLIRRHPHVFGEAGYRTSGEQTVAWEAIKKEERAGKEKHGVLDDVPVGLPALTRAVKLTKRAARVGFDWPSTREVMDKLAEETLELQAEIDAGDVEKARAELGDILFVLANLARKLDVDPEDALRATNAKFSRRFAFIEAELAKDGRTPDQSDLAEMDALWNRAKEVERY